MLEKCENESVLETSLWSTTRGAKTLVCHVGLVTACLSRFYGETLIYLSIYLCERYVFTYVQT